MYTYMCIILLEARLLILHLCLHNELDTYDTPSYHGVTLQIQYLVTASFNDARQNNYYVHYRQRTYSTCAT